MHFIQGCNTINVKGPVPLNSLFIVSNSKLLSFNYCEVIDNFTESWVKLASQFKLSTTPKLHIIIDHLCNYFDETNLTLVKASDEIVKNCHQLFNKRWIKGFAVDLSNPAHGENLYNAVRSFNRYSSKIREKK